MKVHVVNEGCMFCMRARVVYFMTTGCLRWYILRRSLKYFISALQLRQHNHLPAGPYGRQGAISTMEARVNLDEFIFSTAVCVGANVRLHSGHSYARCVEQ